MRNLKLPPHLGVKMDLDELSKSTRVVVADRLCVAERFQQRVRCNNRIHSLVSNSSIVANSRLCNRAPVESTCIYVQYVQS